MATRLKREVVEGDKALDAQRKLNRCANKALRVRTGKDEQPEREVAPAVAPQTISIPAAPGSQPITGPAA